MRQLPKVRTDLKTQFLNDEIEESKLNYLHGGDGPGDTGGGGEETEDGSLGGG